VSWVPLLSLHLQKSNWLIIQLSNWLGPIIWNGLALACLAPFLYCLPLLCRPLIPSPIAWNWLAAHWPFLWHNGLPLLNLALFPLALAQDLLALLLAHCPIKNLGRCPRPSRWDIKWSRLTPLIVGFLYSFPPLLSFIIYFGPNKYLIAFNSNLVYWVQFRFLALGFSLSGSSIIRGDCRGHLVRLQLPFAVDIGSVRVWLPSALPRIIISSFGLVHPSCRGVVVDRGWVGPSSRVVSSTLD
jgi:hypothetical protein